MRALLVLEHDSGVRIPNRSFHKPLRILRAPRHRNFQPGNTSVPTRVVLGVLCSDTRREAIGAAECDVAGLDPAGHVVGLCCGVDDLVDCLHSEVEGHELAYGVEACQCGSDCQAGESGLGDGAVDDSLFAEAV